MKKKLFLIIFSLFIASFNGCKTEPEIFIVHPQNVNTNAPVNSFGDEHYIWETWFFSTNVVPEKVVK